MSLGGKIPGFCVLGQGTEGNGKSLVQCVPSFSFIRWTHSKPGLTPLCLYFTRPFCALEKLSTDFIFRVSYHKEIKKLISPVASQVYKMVSCRDSPFTTGFWKGWTDQHLSRSQFSKTMQNLQPQILSIHSLEVFAIGQFWWASNAFIGRNLENFILVSSVNIFLLLFMIMWGPGMSRNHVKFKSQLCELLWILVYKT